MTTAQRTDSPNGTHAARRGGGAVDPQLVDQTRREIRAIVQEIARLSRSDVSLEEFCEGFLSRVVSALAAVGGAVWLVDPPRRLHLQYQVNLTETGLAESKAAQQHRLLLERIVAAGQPNLVPPQSGRGGEGKPEDEPANPTPQLLLVGLVGGEQQVEAVVEIFQRPGGGPITQRGYLRFLVEMCDLAANFFKGLRLRRLHDRLALWEQWEEFARAAYASLDVNETALVLANEGRRLIACDRVSVALMHGRRCRVEAVSGLDSFDRRAGEIRALNQLARAVVAADEPLFFGGDASLAPQIEGALHEYLDCAHAKSLAVIPLAPPGRKPAKRRAATAGPGPWGR